MKSFFLRAAVDMRGSVAIIVAIAMIALIGVTAVVVDISYIYNVRRQIQNATDQSALAGAQNIYQGTGVATATSYSATSGNKNVSPGVTVTMVSGYPLLKCLTSTGLPCAGTPSANAITVMQTATVPLFFARIFGQTTATITVQATASAAGNQPKPYNIAIIIDTTGSMDTNDGYCNATTQKRITCAKLGGQQLIKGMFPSMDRVALFAFPGVTSATAGRHYDCLSSSASSVAYNASPAPVYTIISLSNDYKAGDTGDTLSPTSNLSRAFGAGGSGCNYGMATASGQGTYFADVINTAQAHLLANATTGTQAVMILLSDGDAGADLGKVGSGKYDDQCQQAVNAATAAKNDTTTKTWIYAVAYSAPTSGGCDTDSPAITPCNTMKAIASSTAKFYASGGSCTSSANPVSDLVTIFARIQSSLTSPRLVPDNTT